MYSLIIVGSGPAGLTAAVYAARANLSPLVIEGMQAGGQLTQTTDVENFPGFAEPISGADLMTAMRQQAERCGASFLMDEVQSVDFTQPVKRLATMMNGTLEARAVIVATGATARWTGLPGESTYRSRGISACATCDGSFFREKDVAVIGGGDTALGDALYLARMCRRVTVIHRRDSFRASKVLAARVAEEPHINVAWNTVVEEFLGDGRRLSALRLKSTVDGALSELPVAGAFVAIGHNPATAFLGGQLTLDSAGCIAIDRSYATSVPGAFAAGDCADSAYRQAVVAAGAGAAAAIEAERYLLATQP